MRATTRGILLASLLAPWMVVGVHAQNRAIDDAVEKYAEQIIRLRQHIHQHPELGNREFETMELVSNHLRDLDFDEVMVGVAHTGVVGILRGGLPGEVVAEDGPTFFYAPAKKHTVNSDFDVSKISSLPKVEISYSYAGTDGIVDERAKGVIVTTTHHRLCSR